MTKTLWAPWRMDYILGTKTEGCVFCHAIAGDEASRRENLVLYVAEHTFVIMNRFPYTYAHIMVVPKDHVDRLEKLEAPALKELMEMWATAQTVVRNTFAPQGLNLGMNLGQAAGAGIEDHLHAHIVPRWNGDTNFIPMLADTRVMPEHLDETYLKLKAAFDALGQMD